MSATGKTSVAHLTEHPAYAQVLAAYREARGMNGDPLARTEVTPYFKTTQTEEKP